VILNLAGNAVKFTERGEVTLSVTVASWTEAGGVLRFAVTDTGVGIAAEKLRLIFDPFTQADGSTTRKYGGTGLGLTISSRLVAAMGGQIDVESEVGKGSSFHFTARFTPARGPLPSVQPLPIWNLRGKTVLVVDDNPTNRRILEEVLRGWGMLPTAVEGGAEALVELKRAADAGAAYPLVLLDAQMPEMDGLELAERIRREPGSSGATIMMLTSVGHQEDAARCRALGLAAYLIKPVKQSELLRAVCTALGEVQSNGAGKGSAARRAPLDSSLGSSLRILLAEDNPVNQLVAVRLLEKAGHTVVLAGDGRAALGTLERERFDLALLDVQMPELDGLEVAAAVRAREEEAGGRLPLIALTAHAMQGDRERCLAAGMDGYLAKPLRADQLFRTIGEVLNGTPRAVLRS
jgi:CheY-like chemotaxis protein